MFLAAELGGVASVCVRAAQSDAEDGGATRRGTEKTLPTEHQEPARCGEVDRETKQTDKRDWARDWGEESTDQATDREDQQSEETVPGQCQEENVSTLVV